MKHLDQTILNLYLDDALPPSARANTDAHLATCETCRAELAALTALGAVFASWHSEPIPHDVSRTVMQEIAKRPAPAWVTRWGALVLGAQLVLAILLVLWLLPTLSQMFGGIPTLPALSFDFNLLANLTARLDSAFALVPSYGLWVWGIVLGIGAVVWLVVTRLVYRSLQQSQETTQ